MCGKKTDSAAVCGDSGAVVWEREGDFVGDSGGRGSAMGQKEYRKIKRGMDICLSAAGLVILSPLFLILTTAIKLDSRGPVIFRQKRVGIHKSYFQILKFRTMRVDTPKNMPTHMLDDPEKYITRVGKILRKTSLDELPQIINILRGDMSIIGPRPALWNQYDLIAEGGTGRMKHMNNRKKR